MRVEAFIPDWPGEKQHAAALVNVLARRYPTTILDDPKDYFNAQWQKARDRFTGDVLLWVMADVTLPDNFSDMLEEMECLMARRGDVGWYAPDVAWTSFTYNKADLKEVEPQIYEVPNTDSLFFAVRTSVVRKMPFIDPAACFMWGMDVVASTVIRQMNLKMVRDYRFKVGHPNDTGYDIEKASAEMGKLFLYFEEIDPRFAGEVRQSINDMNRLKRLA